MIDKINTEQIEKSKRAEYGVLGFFIGLIVMTGFVQLELSPQWVTDQTCNNLTNEAYNLGIKEGVSSVAAYTTNQGMFLIIVDETIQEQNLHDYCTQLNQGGKK